MRRIRTALLALAAASVLTLPSVAHAGGFEFPDNGTEALGRGAAFTAKATLRPAAAVTTPPSDAPMASMADHVALESALAGTSSSADVRFGIVAVRAGSKNAEPATVKAITT